MVELEAEEMLTILFLLPNFFLNLSSQQDFKREDNQDLS
jgi:hypothetical protein